MPRWFRLGGKSKHSGNRSLVVEPSRSVVDVPKTPVTSTDRRDEGHHFRPSASASDMSATDDHTIVPNRIPVELYPLIVEHISNTGSLCILCTVSRAFKHYAERFLYHTINLSYDYDHLLSWTQVIAQNHRLAKLVHTLRLPSLLLFSSSSTLSNGDLTAPGHTWDMFTETVIRAFSALVSLRELLIYTPSAVERGFNYLSPEMLVGHPFRLHSFEVTGCHPQPLTLDVWLEFLREQRDLRHWRPNLKADDGIGQALEEDILPCLVSASVQSPFLNMLAGRPIRGVEIDLIANPHLLERFRLGLSAISQTLTRLSLAIVDDRSGDPGRSGFVVMKIVSTEAPNLKFLHLHTNMFISDEEAPADFHDFFTSLSNLHHLEVLLLKLSGYSPTHPHRKYKLAAVFHTRQDGTFEAEDVVWLDSRPSTFDAGLEFANQFMMSCSALKRVAFSACGSWVKNARWEDGAKMPCYVRSSLTKSGSMAEFEGFDILLDSDSWREMG